MALFNRLRTDPVYNTRAVVQRTGVPADTFRAWERRYGLPDPARTSGNQRLYSDRDLATIAWLRDQTRSGLTISQAVQLFQSGAFDDALDGRFKSETNGSLSRPVFPLFEEDDGEVRASPAFVGDRLLRFRKDMVEALIQFNAGTATRVVEEAVALLSVEDVCLHIMQPALYDIGQRWAAGEVGISAEHFASAFVIRKLGALFNQSQPEDGRGPVLAACLSGELHEVGLLLTCLFLSRRGYRVLYLGPNLPLEDLIDTAQRIRPPLILLSASTPEAAVNLAAASHEFRARCGQPGHAARPTIGFGGGVFVQCPALRASVNGVFLGRDADEAIAAVAGVVP